MKIKEFNVDENITLEKIKNGMQIKVMVAFSKAVQTSIDNKQNRCLAELDINGINKSTHE